MIGTSIGSRTMWIHIRIMTSMKNNQELELKRKEE